MIKNPQAIAESGAVTGTFAVQQNAIDFPLDDLFAISQQWGYLSNDKSVVKHKFRQEVPLTSNANYVGVVQETPVMGWILQPNVSYDGVSNVYVEVPEGMAAMLIARSTLNRNSIKLTSGLYDAGFKGHIGFTLRNEMGHTFIEKGTFVGQIIFFDADSAALYAGSYSAPQGESWIGTAVVTEAPVEVVTEAPAEVVTEAPVEVVTEAPAEVVTEAPVEVVTEAPAEVVTEAPVEVVTETPVDVATEAPVEEVPVEVVTEVPVEVTKEVPTVAPKLDTRRPNRR